MESSSAIHPPPKATLKMMMFVSTKVNKIDFVYESIFFLFAGQQSIPVCVCVVSKVIQFNNSCTHLESINQSIFFMKSEEMHLMNEITRT